MSFFLVLLLLLVGFAIGRCYQWIKQELQNEAASLLLGSSDVRAQRAMSDIAARTRRTEEQVRRLGQPRTGPR